MTQLLLIIRIRRGKFIILKRIVHLSRDMTKPTKWVCAEQRLRSAWVRVFAVIMKKAWVLSYPLSTQRRLWSDWADAQDDLSLHLAHTRFVGFVMSQLIYLFGIIGLLLKGMNSSFQWVDVYRNDPKFQTDRSGQTVQTQIRLLLEEQSDQDLHCLQ